MIYRFYSKAKADPQTGCWNWTGAVMPSGYGRFWIGENRYNGKMFLAHRASMMLSGFDVPDDMVVMHHCDNPGCVNPAHLSVSTISENVRDMVKKGRGPDRSGENNCSAKLTEAYARQIRELDMPVKRIADAYGVHISTVYKIKSGELWA